MGGGISGLAAAYYVLKGAKAAGEAVRVTVIEAAPSFGGKIVTERTGGFLVEGGPDSFISLKPEAIALCEELGLAGELVRTNAALQRTFILCRGRLEPIPDGMESLVPSRLLPFLGTRLLSSAGKARLAMDLFVPPRADGADESVADFIERRLGREFYDRVAEPLLAGIYSGDARKLSLRSTFPQLAAMEGAYGSLVKAVLAHRRAAKPEGEWSLFVTLKDGVGRLVERLATVLELEGAQLRTSARVDGIKRFAGRPYEVRFEDGPALEAEAVVLATPAFESARLLRGLDGRLSAELDQLHYNPAATVTLAYEKPFDHPLEGFGFVVPRLEGRALLACTWSSSKYPGRAPDDHVILRAYFGGVAAQRWLALSDRGLAELARSELDEVMGIRRDPVLSRVFRWERAMPQYSVGHRRWLDGVETMTRAHPGLHLTGAAFRGVGIPDCIKDAAATAKLLLAETSQARPA